MADLVLDAATKVTQTRGLTLQVKSAGERDFVLSQWRELERRVPEVGLLCSADWTDVWLSHYGDLVPHRFVLGYADGQVCGVCLVTEGVEQKDGPLKLRTLHVGTAGEPDADEVCGEYQKVLVLPTHETAFVTQLVKYLNSQRGFDQWQLDGFAGPELAPFVEQDPRLQVRSMPNYFYDLNVARQKGGDLFSNLQKETRRQIRRSLEVIEGVSVDWADSLDLATDVFQELVELHQARWTSMGQPGVYSSERFTRFHEALLARLVPLGKMVFVRVKSIKGTVGCLQILIDRQRACVYQCGWNPQEGRCSPGVLVDYMAMEQCFSRGLVAYDLMSPQTQHKKSLSNTQTTMNWAVHRYPRLKFMALQQARKLKHWIKQRRSSGGPAAEA